VAPEVLSSAEGFGTGRQEGEREREYKGGAFYSLFNNFNTM
jgi:hypothetical protein